jgi:hypothetical protein
MHRNLSFKKTNHQIFCPLCKHLVSAVRVGAMRWKYERCPNCLIGFETEAWIYAFRMILSNLDSKGGQKGISKLQQS